MHVCMFMTKVISLADDAYAALAALKVKNESFSEIVRRLTWEAKRKNLLSMVGAWKDSPEMDEIFKKIIAERHYSKERKVVL